MTDEEKARLNTYQLEPSGLVSDPIPQSKRPTKRLSETGELRLESLVDEIREEADARAPKKAKKERKRRGAKASKEEQAISEDAAQNAEAQPVEEAVSEPTSRPGTGKAPVVAAVLPEPEIEAPAPGTLSIDNPGDPAAIVDGMLIELVAQAQAEAVAAEQKAEEKAEPPADQEDEEKTESPAESGAVEATAPANGSQKSKGKKKRPPMDPWLEDVLDEQEAREQTDFSRYQGQFARLNDFAVVKTDTELARENAIAAKRKEEEDLAAEQAKIENGEVGFISPAGYRIIPSEDLRDVTEDEVNVHARELLASATYDELINWGTRLARETPLFYRAFSIGDVSTVCDVGCGSGRHSIMFAEWGNKVIGIDESGAILKRARALAAESNDKIIQANGEVRFEKGGLCGVADAVGPQRVEAVVCVGDILPRVGSMDQLRDALDDFADALLPSGILVLEFSNHARYVRQNKRTTEPVVFDTTDGTKVFMSVIDYDQENELVLADMLTLTCGKDGRWHVRCERVKYLFISPDTIERELREAGFDVIELAGDFNGKPLSPTQDESIVVVARRKRHRPVSKRKRAVYP